MRKCRDVCQRLFYGQVDEDAQSGGTRMHVLAPRLEYNRRLAQR